MGPKAGAICAFGAEDDVTTTRFDKCVDNGSTVVRLLFRDTATSSFTVNGNSLTYSDNGASIVSYSALPQHVANPSRSTGHIAFSAAGLGPLIFDGAFTSKAHNKNMYILGDIRTTASNAQWPILSLGALRSAKPWMTRLFVAGGNMTFTNVELNEGYFTCRDSYTNHVDGVLVKTHDGVAATVRVSVTAEE